MQSLLLSRDELRELTQRARQDGQAAMLDSAGIPYRIVSGRIIVARAHALAWLEGRTLTPSRAPNMDAIA
jgi:hypothetical protein